MTTKDFLEILQEPANAHRQLRLAEELLDYRASVCQKMTATYEGVGGGGGGGGPKDGAMAAMADASDARDKAADRYLKTKYKLQNFLSDLSGAGGTHDVRHAVLLRLRYLEERSWDSVREEMARLGIAPGSRQTVMNWNLAALDRGRKFWEEVHPDD